MCQLWLVMSDDMNNIQGFFLGRSGHMLTAELRLSRSACMIPYSNR